MSCSGQSVILSRREVMLALGGSLCLGALTSATAVLAEDAVPLTFISAASVSEDRHQIRGFNLPKPDNETGTRLNMLFSFDLPGRAHHTAVDPLSGNYVAVARRPGTWLASGNCIKPQAPVISSVPEGYRLCGHGVYSADGQFFYTLETEEADTGDNGRIGVWQVDGGDGGRGFSRISTLPTYGVGPHEGRLLPGGHTLVVANGGIRTATDDERTKLNVDSMRPSLTYIDIRSGQLLQQVAMADEYHQSSIRHLDVNQDGLVALAMQFEGEPFRDVPLVGLHRLGEAEIGLSDIPLFEQQQLNQYCGSVRFDETGHYLAVSSPRGNRITFWDVQSNSFIKAVRSRDGCGVCALEDGFVFTSGVGRVAFYSLANDTVTDLGDQDGQRYLWDNHLSRV